MTFENHFRFKRISASYKRSIFHRIKIIMRYKKYRGMCVKLSRFLFHISLSKLSFLTKYSGSALLIYILNLRTKCVRKLPKNVEFKTGNLSEY